MGANRQMRRQQARQQMNDWIRTGTAEKVRRLNQGGISQQDFDEYHKKWYEEGYKYASTAFMKKMYAAMAKVLTEAGNSKEDVYSFIHSVDQKFAVMFDADEEIESVLNEIGVRINLNYDGLSTVEVVSNGKE